jgi:hypothetical protein
VDDDKDIIYHFDIYLKSIGYSTVSFVNPVEALNYFNKNFTNCNFGYNRLWNAFDVWIRFNKKDKRNR